MSGLLQALALVAVFAVPGFAQDDAAPSQTDRGQTALERWNRLDPEQQERMRGRFERWQKLSVEERDEYKRRSDELGRARKEALRQLRKEDRERFETLDKATQDGVLRELTHLTLVERTQRLRDKLPPEAQARLEGASPEERRAILHELRRGELHKAGERALEDLARKLGLAEEEIDAIRALPRRERHEKLLALKRRAIESGALDGMRPEDVDERSWEKMRDLPPRDFARDLFRHKDRGDMSRGDRKRRQIQEMLMPTLDELIEVSRAPGAERRALMERLVRTRVQAEPAGNDKLPKGLLEDMQSASDHEFIRRLRHFTRPPRHPEGHSRRPGEEGRARPREQGRGRAGDGGRPGPAGGPDHPRGGDRPGPQRDRRAKPDGVRDARHFQGPREVARRPRRLFGFKRASLG